jgi:hypothetical protein
MIWISRSMGYGRHHPSSVLDDDAGILEPEALAFEGFLVGQREVYFHLFHLVMITKRNPPTPPAVVVPCLGRPSVACSVLGF